ncbi:gephyrin-like molybdotransferase Glp [Euzebya tangerina]|uniref:molybdopterin molybdotransferase MoeA n=1 Tax=Euzebya tangerina TaxID=591198 RepID=UPI000E31F6F9|nr:gephyrin-like molybdotransferase Glp [Euzebya tangerina]
MGDRHHVDPGELTAVGAHRHTILSGISPGEPTSSSLLEARGLVLAEDVTAPGDIPPFANSAMDGFAVVADAVGEGSRLRVAGEIAAGAADLPSPRGDEAIRIMTGAPIPAGATAVVPVELVREQGGEIVLDIDPAEGENLREAGESVRAGEAILASGTLLGPSEIGLLAAMGIPRVHVHPKVRVATLATGDELVEPGKPLAPGQIHESNSYGLAAQVAEAGAVAYRQPTAPDDRQALRRAFSSALSTADILVTSGGVSAGTYDLSKQVMAEMGNVVFSKVAMQPGMPQAFGTIDGVVVFGLPGNPVSAAVSFEIFVRPAIRRMQGRADLNRPRLRATLGADIRSPEHKVSFLRVTLAREDDGWVARTTGAQGSGILKSMVLADGLAEVPVERTSMSAGEQVTVHLLSDPT